jgi:uncharacterized protein
MLRSFRLANHKSIRQEQELLLLPVFDHGRPVQPVTAIYGANASGKSTLLDGLAFMKDAVTDSYARWDPKGGVPRRPFRLDPAARDEPSVFVVDLELEGVRHTYGFAVDDQTVRDEWLHSYPEKKRRVIFERTGSEIKLGSTVPGRRGKADVLEELTRPNALFLSVASRVNFAELVPVYNWFAGELLVSQPNLLRGPPLNELLVDAFTHARSVFREIVDLVKFADIGISDITVTQIADRRHHVRFIHTQHDDPFDIDDESAGTRAWLATVLQVIAALAEGFTMVVDEIDTSLHPRLTARLLALFQDKTTNPKLAQLICTTHDTTLLSPTLGEQALTRDQVWFTEKNDAGETNLHPLSDFRPRKGENIERRYLGGSYGAVPRTFPEDFAALLGRSDGAA